MTDLTALRKLATDALEIAAKATPGPWFLNRADDEMHMNMDYISTEKKEGHQGLYSELPSEHMEKTLAITCHQITPKVGMPSDWDVDGNWQNDGLFTSGARDLVPALARAVLELLGVNATLAAEIERLNDYISRLRNPAPCQSDKGYTLVDRTVMRLIPRNRGRDAK